jgi:hypothetical protein
VTGVQTCALPIFTFNWLEDTNILLSQDRPCEGDSVIVTALVVSKRRESAMESGAATESAERGAVRV